MALDFPKLEPISISASSNAVCETKQDNGHSRSSSVFSEDTPLPLVLPVVQPRVNAYQHPSPMGEYYPNPFSSSPPLLDTRDDREAVLPKNRVRARLMEFEKKGEYTTYRFPKQTNGKKRDVSKSSVEPKRAYTRQERGV